MSGKAERTKQFIVEKTSPVFNQKGYAGTSIQDLMQATGLSKGSIYGNFDNKDEVAIAAFEYNFGKVVDYLKSRISVCDNAIDKLLVYPETYKQFFQIPFLQYGCPLLNTSTEADDTHPALREKAQKAHLYWKKSLMHIIEEGKNDGTIRTDVSTEEFTNIMVALIEGGIMQAKLTGKSEDIYITMKYLEKIILELKS